MPNAVTIVILGASGDLTARKLMPALYENFRKGRLPEKTLIVGAARRTYTNAEFRAYMHDAIKLHTVGFTERTWTKFARLLTWQVVDLSHPGDFATLESALEELEPEGADRVYYLATAPEFYGPAAEALAACGAAMQADGSTRRLVVEKPFGTDAASAHALNERIHAHWHESQVYRIDHYLGKETAQNILYLRFANTIFEPIWKRNYINNIQVTVAETVDVDHRAGYYDQAGIIRDMFQNHILQLLALVTMEPPSSFAADAVRNEKVKLLSAIRPIGIEQTVRGQYRGYRSIKDVATGSQTPTFAAMQLFIDNWRWQGVPIYLRSGKSLARRTSEIAIEFNRPPHVIFDLKPGEDLMPNVLTLGIQPDEGVHFTFQAKAPDARTMQPVDMDFHYSDHPDGEELPEAYQRLLLDVISGDASLFARSDEIERSWQIMDPVLDAWEKGSGPPLVTYARGSWGPAAADELLSWSGRQWWSGHQQ